MEGSDLHVQSTFSEGCLYGTYDRANRSIFEYHSLSLIVGISVASMLLFNTSLFRFYAPLAKIANLSIGLQVLSDVLYFAFYPYSETEGNCSEIYVGRLYIAAVMFGELHQIYLLANMLGMGTHRFKVGKERTISIDATLKIATIFIVISIAYSIFVHHSFKMIRNLWCIFVCMVQIYFIRLSRRSNSTDPRLHSSAAFSASVSSIRVYEKLSTLQLLPASLCFAERMCYLFGFDLIPHFDAVTLVLDILCNFLFYLKILLIKENSDVKVEVLDV